MMAAFAMAPTMSKKAAKAERAAQTFQEKKRAARRERKQEAEKEAELEAAMALASAGIVVTPMKVSKMSYREMQSACAPRPRALWLARHGVLAVVTSERRRWYLTRCARVRVRARGAYSCKALGLPARGKAAKLKKQLARVEIEKLNQLECKNEECVLQN